MPRLEEALRLWRDQLGLELRAVEEVPSEGVRVAILYAGSTRIELLEPLGDDSPVRRHLERRGPGLHHVALRTDRLEAAMERLRAAGCSLLSEEPRAGAGGARIVFVHPKSAGGVLLELTSGHA